MSISLYYEEKGQGIPFIMLHGNGENCEYFKNQIEYFSTKYRVIAPDTRGHGKTPRGEGEFSILRFAEDLKEFMDALKIEQAIILGFSDGANIAMEFALRYGSRIKALILNGGNMYPKGVRAVTQIPIEIGYSIAKLFAKNSVDAKRNAEVLGLMVNQPKFTQEMLGRIQAPTLVIAGTHDMIKRRHTQLIADSIPEAELRIIHGNHFIAARNSQLFNREVERFLETACN